MMRPLTLGAMLSCLSLIGQPGGVMARDGALPLALAFDRPELQDSITLAPDGRQVAYGVHDLPSDVSAAITWGRRIENDVYIHHLGSRIHVADVRKGDARAICDNGGSAWRPSWSPDGRTLAFYSDAGGMAQLWVYGLDTGQCRRLGTARIAPKFGQGDEPRWSPDGTSIYVHLVPAGKPLGYYYQAGKERRAKKTAADLEFYASGSEAAAVRPSDALEASQKGARRKLFMDANNVAVGVVDVVTGETRVLVPADAEPFPSVVRLSPSGKWLTMLSVWLEKPEVNSAQPVYDLSVLAAAGSSIQVIARDMTLPLTDYYRHAYAWHPRDDRLVYLKNGALFLVDFDAAGARPPVRLAEGLGPLANGLHWFTSDGTAVVVGTDLDTVRAANNGLREPVPTGLAVVPLDGGPVTTIALDFDRWAFEGLIKADARTVWQPDGTSLTVKLRDVATGELVVMRYAVADGSARELWRGRASIRDLSATADGNALVGAYEDINTPKDVYRFNNRFSRKTRLSTIVPQLDGVTGSTARVFTTPVPMHDHSFQTLRSAVLLPEGHQPGTPLPAIVTFYPDSDASRLIDRFGGGNRFGVPSHVFTSRGYAVLYVHVKPGPGGQPGHVLDEMVDTLLPQVYRAAELGLVDPTRLVLTGNSFGGYATAAIVARTNLFRAAIPVNGIYDLPSYVYGTAPDGWVAWAEHQQPRLGAPLWADRLRYIDNSPLFLADRIKTPLLILQGGDDWLRPEAEKLFTALKRLDRPAQLAVYERSGHWIAVWPLDQAIAGTERILDFVERHVGTPQR